MLNQSWQYVLSEAQEVRRNLLVVTSYHIHRKAEMQTSHLTALWKQKRSLSLFLAQRSPDWQLRNDSIRYLLNYHKPDDEVTMDKSYFRISTDVMFNQSEENCNYFALFLANFKERES